MISPPSSELARERLISDNELPPLPAGWDVRRFRFLFRESPERNGDMPVGSMLSVSEYYGVAPKEYESDELRRTDEYLQTYRVVRPGQLAVNTMWLNHLGLGISAHLGHVSPAYAVYNISEEIDERFAHHLFRSQFYLKIYMRYLYGIRPNSFQIKTDDWNSIPIIVPPRETQKAIADFLDRETARIDQLIEKKRRLVDLLENRLKRLADQVVGQIEGCPVIPLRRVLVGIEQGWSPECEARLKEADEWAVLKVGCVNGWSFNEDQHKVLPRHLEPRSHLEIKDGDVLMSRANTRDLVGSVAIVRNPPRRLLLCDKLYRLKFDTRKIEPRYAVIALRSDVSRNHYEMNSNGASASMQNIGQETVRTLTLSLPEIERQVELADRFEEAAQNTTALTTAIQRTLQGLAEHRAALITAAVTGQIDVATWDKRGESDRRLDVLQEGMGA